MRRGVVLAVAAGLALAGCGDVSPGAAATVDGTTIAMDDVDAIARSYCTAEVTYAGLNEQQWQAKPTSVYRDTVLTQLVNEQLAEEVVEDLGIDVPPSTYEVGSNPELEALLAELPSDQREPFQDYLDSFGRVQALFSAIGTDQGAEATEDDPSAALAAGQEYVADYAEDRDIELDPRFGEFSSGQVVGASGSLSVPVTGPEDEAAAEDPAATAEPEDVSDLPDSQICE